METKKKSDEYNEYFNAGYPVADKIYTVTGGTGYIGSKLLEYLSEQEDTQVYAIIRKGSKPKIIKENIIYIQYDGTEESIQHVIYYSDYLIHLGALYTTNIDEKSTEDLIISNIMFSTKLFNIVNRINKNLIITTASTFSFLNENGEYAPTTLYSATKKAVEDIAMFYKDLSIHFLTLPDTYGPGDWRPKIHNILMKNKSWPFIFRSRSDQEIRLMHVEDVIGYLLGSLELTGKGVHIHDIYVEGDLLTLKQLSERITIMDCEFTESAELTKIPKKVRKESVDINYKKKHEWAKFIV